MYQLALGPMALAFVGSTDIDSINRMKVLEQHYQEKWPQYWLKEKGIENLIGDAA